MSRAEQWLVILLRIVGWICLLALVAFFMPRLWMEKAHEWLGLGSFPAAPIAEYLARTTSALCAFYGGLLLVLASDVQRYARIITFQAIAIMALSACGVFLSRRAGMPLWWVIGDAVGCWAYCLPMVILVRRISASRKDA